MNKYQEYIKSVVTRMYTIIRTTVGTVILVAIGALLVQHFMLTSPVNAPAPTFKNLALCEDKGIVDSAIALVMYPFRSGAELQVEKGWFSQKVSAVFAGQIFRLGGDGKYHPVSQ